MAERMTSDDLFEAVDPDEIRALAANIWTELLRAGDAYSIGGTGADPNGAAEDLGGELMIPTHGDQRVAVYRMPDGRAILAAQTKDGLWAVDLLPRSAWDEMVRPGGTLMDDQEYEELQMAAERAAARQDLGDELDRVIAGPNTSGPDASFTGVPRVADPMEDSEPPEAAADTVRGLMDEMEKTSRDYPDVVGDEKPRKKKRDEAQKSPLRGDPRGPR